MKISIITISFNSAGTIEETIQSVLKQNFRDLEYILIDGGSTDETPGIIHKYRSRIPVFISEPDKGIYDAMNKGLSLASGDVIGILNSDDLYADENVLRDVADAFQSTGADALYADLVYVNRKKPDMVTRKWISGEYKPGSFKRGWMPPHPAFFVRREIYQKLGCFDTRLSTSADYEIMLRFMHKHKIKTTYLRRVIIKMRAGGQSNISLRNRIKANREDRLAWRLNNLKPGLFTTVLKPLRKIGQFFS